MAVHFHPLTISHLQKETADCVSVCFYVPQDLQDIFQYKEGQNITLRKSINGEELRRSYSICTAPHEKKLRIAIKKVDQGLFSTFANQDLKIGDSIDVLPPTGKFNSKANNLTSTKNLAIAAGSGITPVISIIKHILEINTENTFTLIYGNQSRNSIIFFEELEALKNKFIERFNFITILSRERTDADINFGRIDLSKLNELQQLLDFKSFDDIFICGPEQMIFTAEKFLLDAGIEKSNIHFELFTTPGQQQVKSLKKEIVETDNSPKSKIEIKVDGRTFNFELGYDSDSILDAALKQGADLPFACKGGVCCTCRAKVLSGNVKMDVNYALEDEEVEEGFVLTCQSHPTTDFVSIDFDVK